MRSTSLRIALLAVVSLALPASRARGQLWKQFLPTARVESDTGGNYTLTDENGPWHIMAATFSGQGAEQQANELVLEFRQRYNLPAYIHEMSFDFSEQSPGRGLDEYGAPVRHRYRREKVHQFAVLVGDFPSLDDPEAQALLKRVKTMQPDALNPQRRGTTSQTMTQIRRMENAVLAQLGKERQRGPMAQAFLVRNPRLPREYFVPQGVDPFVAKMNDGVEHSLLDCRGRYSVQVATFRGNAVLQTSGEKDSSSAFGLPWNKKEKNPLVVAAENAHLLTMELRSHGWEAYEFHNRTESIVTIGSFDEVARRLPDGRLEPTAQVQRIITTFGAAYDTPADPLTDIGNDPDTQQRVLQQQQQFNNKIAGQYGTVTPGMHPKHVKIFNGRRLERIIPIDITPHAIKVPQPSVSATYARGVD